MKKENDVISINGKKFTLESKLGGGTEGTVFSIVEDSRIVVKILDESKMTENQRKETYDRLVWLKELGHRNEDIRKNMAIPLGLLDDELGYAMRRASDHEVLDNYIPEILPENFDEWYKNEYTLKRRYQIIVNLFRTLRMVHLSGLIFTDLSPNNIVVHKSKNQIGFIDTDNIRKRTDYYLGVLGTPGYMAPELYLKDNRELENNSNNRSKTSECGIITVESDIFSAAIIAFKLLTLQHPFVGDKYDEGPASELEEALQIKSDYIFKKNTTNSSTYGLTIKYDELTTPEVRELFHRTFVDGKDNPYLRPTDEEFIEVFQKALDLIVTCDKCGFSRLLSMENNNSCINCNEMYEKKVVMRIYNEFENVTREELINSIDPNEPRYDVSDENLIGVDDKASSNRFEICKIVLGKGEKNNKFLYPRHFEKGNDLSKPWLSIYLNENLEEIVVKKLNDAFELITIINTKEGYVRNLELEKAKAFKYHNHKIVFESKSYNGIKMMIVAEFEEV